MHDTAHTEENQRAAYEWVDVPSWYGEARIPLLIADQAILERVMPCALAQGVRLVPLLPAQLLHVSTEIYGLNHRRVYVVGDLPNTLPDWTRLVDILDLYTMEVLYVSSPRRVDFPGAVTAWLDAATIDLPPRPEPQGKRDTDTRAWTIPYSDYFNALELVRDHGQDLRFCHPWGKWLRWVGTHWQMDQSGAVMRDAKATMVRLLQHAQTLPETEADQLFRHVKSSLSTGKLKSLIENAQSEKDLYVFPEQLDQDPWLLNVANGTIDLRTGILQGHQREDLLTRCLPTPYQRDAPCPIWDRFLRRILGGSGPWSPKNATAAQREAADERARDLGTFVQRFLGWCLTGYIGDEVLVVFWGRGKNGKSTLINTMLTLLGPYGMKATSELLLVSRQERHPTERTDLFRMRLVATVETSEGSRLNEAWVKEATGGDRIRARRMREDNWEFEPTHKIVMATNHKPTIRGTDHAIWRRIRLVPFTVIIPPEERDGALPLKLRQELPGILAWLVRGCLEWQREGLGEPKEVHAATEDYRQEMDVLGRFIEECCVLRTYASVTSSLLYQAYRKWCEASGEYPLSQYTLGLRLADIDGLSPGRGTHGVRLWQGLGLVAGDTGDTGDT